MTDGRFEEIKSVRPNNWDQRRLWCERPQFQKLDPEIRYDESCPFHDLKADGCFQPEYGLMHDNDKRIEPETLTKRKDGNRMRMGGPQGKHNGMGGYLMPVDTAAPRAASAPKLAGKPWGTGGKIGLFSRPEYIASPAPPAARPVSTAPRAAPYSGAIKLGAPVPYMPDDRTATPKDNRWRLATGTYNAKPLPPVLPALPAKSEEPVAVPLPIRRDPFHNPHHGGAFGQHPTHMPTPYKDCPDRRRAGGALFTYAAKSKRTAPVQVPWSTLVQTADPAKDYPRQDYGSQGYGGQTNGSDFAKQTTVHHGSPGYTSPQYERQRSSGNKNTYGSQGYERQSSKQDYTKQQSNGSFVSSPKLIGTHDSATKHGYDKPTFNSANFGRSNGLTSGQSLEKQTNVRRDYGAGYEKLGNGRQSYLDA